MLAICAALEWEIRPILRAVGNVKSLRVGSLRLWQSVARAPDVVVFRTGIGCDAAGDATRHALRTLPIRTIINTGCAGALAPHLEAGSLIIPEALLDLSSTHTADIECVRRLRAAAHHAGLPSNDGPILTSRRVLATRIEKNAAYAQLGATAVEMEGTAVAEVATEHGSRFGSVRAILDTSELELPVGSSAHSALRLALRTVASPRQLPAVVSLANAVNAAQTSLQAFFRCLLDESSFL